MLIRFLILLTSLAFFATPVAACSLIDGAFLQSNFEMIDSSDAIVVARAVRQRKSNDFDSKVFFDVEEILKGSPPNEVADDRGHFGKPMPSNPDVFLLANPEAYRGRCNRHTYRRGDRYVLMLKNMPEHGFIVYGDAFSRINEDDFGRDSMWRRAIQTYLRIQENPDRMAQLAELEELVTFSQRENATDFEKQLGIDALRHLLSVHPDKPTQWLLDRYHDPDIDNRLFNGVIADTGEDPDETMVARVYGGVRWAEKRQTMIVRALAEGDHPDAAPLFHSIVVENATDATQLGAALAFFVRQKNYALVKAAFAEHILWVTGVTGPGSGPGFWGTVQRAVGYGEDRDVDPEFADWWDRQKLANCFIRSGPFSCRYGRDEIAALLDDPRGNETLLLAGAKSPEVIAWAEAELDRLKAEGVKTHHRDWDFPRKLLLAAYDGDGPKRVHELACGSKEMRWGLADSIGRAPTRHTKNLLREMMAMEQHKHVRKQLFESAVLFAANDKKGNRRGNANLAYAYARADGPIPLREYDDKHLKCSK